MGSELALETSAGPRRADAVVLALPAEETLRVAATLLVPAEREALASSRSVAALVMHLAVERSPTRKATRIRVPRSEGLPLATIAVEPGGSGGLAPEGSALVSLVATPAWSRVHLQADDSVVEKELLGALGRALPLAAAAIRFREIRRYAEALPQFEVGRYRKLARLRGLQVEQRAGGRRLYFAGDHWLAPTLEGAIASGRRAALELAADLGLSAR
jgi:protoporphyrinogen oxidase